MRVGAFHKLLLASTGALSVSACGGGGNAAIDFIPPPPAAPAQVISSASPLRSPPNGVTSTTDLSSIGILQDVRWNAQTQMYEVQIAGTAAHIVPTQAASFAEVGNLVAGDGSTLGTVQAWTGYQYTRVGHVTSAQPGGAGGAFAFGVATPIGSVPITGTADYEATIDGHAGDWGLYGTAQFQFDFAAGRLSGTMDPHTNGPMESPALPRYTFTQTVFSAGSPTFSGSFDIAGPTPSSFQGQFTGPNAQELMATFKAPFLDWDASENPTVSNVMEGVMVGKRR